MNDVQLLNKCELTDLLFTFRPCFAKIYLYLTMTEAHKIPYGVQFSFCLVLKNKVILFLTIENHSHSQQKGDTCSSIYVLFLLSNHT